MCAVAPLVWLQPPGWAAYIPLAIILGNLPDVDTTASYVGRVLFPISRYLEANHGHRTLTHSLLACAVVYVMTYVISPFVESAASVLASRSLSHSVGSEAFSRAFAFNVVGDAPPAAAQHALWCSLFYGSHLVLDMIIGGHAGVQFLWPLKWRFWLLNVRSGSQGAHVCAWLLLGGCVLPFVIDPSSVSIERFLHVQGASQSFAEEDYRRWESEYYVSLDIQGTWQSSHTPITGRYQVVELAGNTFVLRDPATGKTFTAGNGNPKEDVYLLKAVAYQDAPRGFFSMPTPIPRMTDVPGGWPNLTTLVVIRVDHIYQPALEIKVRQGQIVHAGDLVAERATYRQRRNANPNANPPTSQPTNPTALLAQQQAAAELELARAVYSQSLQAPAVVDLTGAKERITAAQNEVNYQIQRMYVLTTALAYAESTGDWSEVPYLVGEQNGPKGKRTDVLMRDAIARTQVDLQNARASLSQARAGLNNSAASAPAITSADVAVAKSQLELAQVKATRAALPGPTSTPRPPPTPVIDRIYTTVSGLIVGIQISQQDDGAVVEIYVDTATSADQAALAAWRDAHRGSDSNYVGPGANLDSAAYYRALNPTPTPTQTQPFQPPVTLSPAQRHPVTRAPPPTGTSTPLPASGCTPDPDLGPCRAAIVVRIGDGDTFVVNLDGVQETVRIIGIDTPESRKPNTPVQCYAEQAADYLAGLMPVGSTVVLQVGREPRDRFNRLLAYVWKDGQPIAEQLLVRGYARTMAIRPNTDRAAHYDALMRDAQQGGGRAVVSLPWSVSLTHTPCHSDPERSQSGGISFQE